MVETIDEHTCFGGVQGFYRHRSDETGLPMKFSVYQPPLAARKRVPALFYLAGLTCTEATFPIKAGAQRLAAELGVMLISPDTSPRSTGIAGEGDHWEIGTGAGFYLDASQAPWSKHFRMGSYVANELRELVCREFKAAPGRLGIMGHSMGGHGALTLALKNPGVYKSVSALAPICAPSRCSWGVNAFTHYLGPDKQAWAQHDASELMRGLRSPYPAGILVDQGLADKFLQDQLHPELLEEACEVAQQPLTLRRHAGCDHGYFFVQTHIEDHLRFHAARLSAQV